MQDAIAVDRDPGTVQDEDAADRVKARSAVIRDQVFADHEVFDVRQSHTAEANHVAQVKWERADLEAHAAGDPVLLDDEVLDRDEVGVGLHVEKAIYRDTALAHVFDAVVHDANLARRGTGLYYSAIVAVGRWRERIDHDAAVVIDENVESAGRVHTDREIVGGVGILHLAQDGMAERDAVIVSAADEVAPNLDPLRAPTDVKAAVALVEPRVRLRPGCDCIRSASSRRG